MSSLSERSPKIAVVGGGIGGMALALALEALGFRELEIFESAAETRELGVGINLLPHATRELDALGLLEALEQQAIATAELAYYTSRGQRIWSEPRGRAAGYEWPQLSIHRGVLLGVLHRAVLERIGPARLHHSHHLRRFELEGDRVRALFVDPRSGREQSPADFDLLVGCDGVHSQVRATLVPDEGPPKWNGVTMWRGVSEAAPFLSGRTMIMAGHSAHRVVVYPIAERGDRVLINWVAEHRGEPGRPMPVQDWDHRVDIDELLELFADSVFPFLDFPALARAAEAVYRYPMVDRDPLPAWTRGRVTLLGDAAHPMYPVGSNGASQAILDARALAAALAEAEVDAALARYEAERRPATAKLVELNRSFGPERCMDIAHARCPEGFASLDEVFAPGELEDMAASYKAVAGFALEQLGPEDER